MFEIFHANPFWKAFYFDPKRYSFETEITFLLQHYHALKMIRASQNAIICDFSFLLDRAYADLNLKHGQRRTFNAVYDLVIRELGRPRLVVHLRCTATTELVRIKNRQRKEEQSVSLEYLRGLNSAVEKQVAIARDTKVLAIDSHARDFANNKAIQAEVADEVLHALGASA